MVQSFDMNSVITPVRTEERVGLGIRPGDTVRVHQKVMEKGKTRIQIFEGLVLAVKHGSEAGGTFTVRAMMSGVGVEKIFPLYSPVIDKIEITKRSKVRRSKLYFIREKVAREVRRQLRNMRMVKMSTDDFAAPVVVDLTEETPSEEAVEETPVVEETPEVVVEESTEEVVPAQETETEMKKEEAA